VFQRILIANRGEIACRVARTCRRLGIESVAVHSRADRAALHVRSTDHALALTGPGSAHGYLDAAQIVDAARRAGADAVHPGYGFLSENAAFAAACDAAGIVFIGPPADVIRDMGDKAHARRLARDAGVVVVPGIEESDTAAPDRDHALCAAAAALEPPLMVKACAGGGGRGMRRVECGGDLAAAIALARREALAGFGDDRLIVERCIERPRHVEVQVLGDAHGTLLHLHERDCSIQRRHQKILEEAPAPDLAPDTRGALHAAALTLARAIGYRNAGTVEFILDPGERSFYFLEMNTRLQVEHPVTEAILGIDLVEWQIRVAAGEALPFRQDALEPRGWAMEARINAEDPEADFRPATGTVALWRPPTGEGVRVDSGIDTGSPVQPLYDPLLAKVVVHGRDRGEAAARLGAALEATVIAGLRSNAAFLATIAHHPAFSAAQLSTGFVTEHFPDGWRAPVARTHLTLAAAAALCGSPPPAAGPWASLRGFRVLALAGHAARWRVLLEDGDGATLAVWARHTGTGLEMTITTTDAPPPDFVRAHTVGVHRDGEALDLVVDGRRARLLAILRGDVVHLCGAAGWHGFRRLDAALATPSAEAEGGPLEGAIPAPVPGVVASVEVAPGDRVDAGQTLVVLESMKMYQAVAAPAAGRVRDVQCAAGDTVAAGQALVTLEAAHGVQPHAAD
jgi:acetyl/propionyl-CoA carboxylase alpha subunit